MSQRRPAPATAGRHRIALLLKEHAWLPSLAPARAVLRRLIATADLRPCP
jgi:hypothetical protein